MRHGCDMGDRMTGKSKNYVWRETVFGFEVVLFIKEGIRSHHVSWSITSKRLDLFFVNHKVFGDEFQHSIDHEEAAWTLTEAATRYPPMTSDEVDRLYHSSPLSVPLRLDLPSTPAKQPGESDAAALTAPSSSSSPLLFSQEEKREEGQRKTRRQQKGEGENLHSPFLSSFPAPTPIGQLPDESTSYTCEALLSSFKAGELDSLRLPLQQPALHILLPKSPNWREMWGSPFKFV
ncbi:hypothetical protein CSUI_011269 [Cystoisospora suis]|uniref:Uncharacterized protein n=1 Tax=Cystoisospora suis TaxID=483139 RepID=A0A2C6JTB9_9APIC|nr:hypothetical protein CSUI_011269 [Cystoisospora suis]